MGQVSIEVNGRQYAIACDDGEEQHIASLGAVLAERIDQLAGAVGQVGDARLLVMAGLLLLDERHRDSENHASAQSCNTENKGTEHYQAQIEILANRIERLAQQAELVADHIEGT